MSTAPDSEALETLRQTVDASTEAPASGSLGEPLADESSIVVGAAQAAQLSKISKFVAGKFSKAANRFLPGWIEESDQSELEDLLAPILTKHADKLGAWFEKWFEEIMLGVWVVDKGIDAYDLIQARKAAKAQPAKDEAAKPT